MFARLRHILGQKTNLAVIFSSAALVGSYGKVILDFITPSDQLIVIISSNDTADTNPFPISIDQKDKTLRLDPELPMAFINHSPNYVLVNSVVLSSPFITAKRIGKDVCDADHGWTLAMQKFNFSE